MLYYNIAYYLRKKIEGIESGNEENMQTLLKATQAYKIVQNEKRDNRLSHAYLLLLDDSRNLREALKIFATLLLVGNNEDEHSLRISKLIQTESFSDCLFYPAIGKKLTVEDANAIHEECTLSPVEGEVKLIVLSDFAEANTQTQNKLLKLLEEPPKHVLFLLGATSAFPVLTTVLSRTKKLEIPAFDVEKTTECLARIYGEKFDKETLRFCAAASEGNIGGAQNLLEGGYYKTLTEQAFSLVLSPSHRLPLAVKEVAETKYPRELISTLRLIFRDALLLKTQNNAERFVLLRLEKDNLQKVADRYALKALFFAQTALSNAEKQIKFNAVFSQCIELCIAQIWAENE